LLFIYLLILLGFKGVSEKNSKVFERCLRTKKGRNLRHVIWGCFENKIRGAFEGLFEDRIQGGRYLNM
jgi:hypothetical protein